MTRLIRKISNICVHTIIKICGQLHRPSSLTIYLDVTPVNSLYTSYCAAPSSQACDGYDKGHGLLLTNQMVSQGSGSKVKLMARGYIIAHWDQTLYVMTELSGSSHSNLLE